MDYAQFAEARRRALLKKMVQDEEDKITQCRSLENTSIDKYFRKFKDIAGGGYGEVYSAHVTPEGSALDKLLPEAGSLVAVKKIIVRPTMHKLLKNELSVLKKLDLKYSAKYYGCYIEGHIVYIVMELIPGQDLFETIVSDKIQFSPEDKIDIFLKIAEGIAEIHAAGVIHRDIKLENVMFSGKNDIKIVDFGLACDVNLQVKEACSGSNVGTPGYIDPKIKSGDVESMRLSDWWAFGQLLVIILAGNPILRTKYGYRPFELVELNLYVPSELRTLLYKLTDPVLEQSKRPGQEEILRVLRGGKL